jgi:AcrR family transcriptional regulator
MRTKQEPPGHVSTRDRIIDTARRLFNENGVMNVRSRNISAALAISNGNLTYHFPTIESLVEAVFDQMLQESSSQVGSHDLRPPDLIGYMTLIEWFAGFQVRYGFFYKDLLDLIRNYPRLAGRYRSTVSVRSEQGREMLGRLQQAGVLNATLSRERLQRLQAAITMTMTYWQAHAEVAVAECSALSPEGMPAQVLSLLEPYLTTIGAQQRDAFIRSRDSLQESEIFTS